MEYVTGPGQSTLLQDHLEPDPAAVGFILHLSRVLHSYGESSQRLENIVAAMAGRLGLSGTQFFSQPTSIVVSFGPLERQRTHVLQIDPGDVNLAKLAAVEAVVLDFVNGRISRHECTSRTTSISDAPPPYGSALVTLAFGGISGAACQLLGGGLREILAAVLLGLVLWLLRQITRAQPRVNRDFEPLAAIFLSGVAVVLARLVGPFSVFLATLSSLMVLLPALTLTTALSELANRHLTSGTARLSAALITLLGIGFGVALGNQVGPRPSGLRSPMKSCRRPLGPSRPPWSSCLSPPWSLSGHLRATPRGSSS